MTKRTRAPKRKRADAGLVGHFLPQRPPFLFIDRIVKRSAAKKTVVCTKRFSGNEDFFAGHFPGNPVVPGVILVEAMAQAGLIVYGVLKPGCLRRSPAFFLGKVEARFLSVVRPGDTLTIEARGEKVLDTGGIVKARALVKGRAAAEATIMYGVKFNHG